MTKLDVNYVRPRSGRHAHEVFDRIIFVQKSLRLYKAN